MKDFPLGKVLIETVNAIKQLEELEVALNVTNYSYNNVLLPNSMVGTILDRSVPIGIALSNILNKRNIEFEASKIGKRGVISNGDTKILLPCKDKRYLDVAVSYYGKGYLKFEKAFGNLNRVAEEFLNTNFNEIMNGKGA